MRLYDMDYDVKLRTAEMKWKLILYFGKVINLVQCVSKI